MKCCTATGRRGARGTLRYRHHRRRHQRLRHRARCGRARAFPSTSARRRTSPAPPPRPPPSSSTAGCAISNITSSGSCARRSWSARCCCAPRRTSSGRCASSSRTTRACGRPGSSGSASFSTTISAAESSCPRPAGSTWRAIPPAQPLKPEFRNGFEYSDCWVEDARLVVLNAMDAAARGAVVETRTEMVKAERRAGGWRVLLRDAASGAQREIGAKVLVNAAGPWVAELTAEPARAAARRARPARQGQPHRRAESSSSTTAPTSSRTPTGGSSSPSPTSTTSR